MNQFSLEKREFIHSQISKLILKSDDLVQFIMYDKIINQLIQKYFGLTDLNETNSKLLLDRLNLCHRFITNPELSYDKDSVDEMLGLCPNDYWSAQVGIDFHNFDLFDPAKCTLDTLKLLRQNTLEAFKNSSGLKRFCREFTSNLPYIKSLLGDIYDGIDGKPN